MAARRPQQAELQQILDAARQRLGVPGAVAGVALGGRDLVASSGVTSVDDPLPVDDATLFLIGSTSKTFTATAMMRLSDQGRLSLDDGVVDHLPRFRLRDRAATRALTLRHLLTHTGGWDGDIFLDTGWGDDALQRYVDTLRDQPQLFPPGAVWSYSNAGFCVAGRIIEAVCGTTYERAISDLLLRPLGMHSSFFSPIDMATRRFAVGHFDAGRGAQVVHGLGATRSIAPAGGLASTVRDQLTWARFHMGDGAAADGRRILRRRTMRLMQSDLVPAGGMADSVGVSWLIRDRGARTVGHGGNASNLQLSTFLMVPERGFAVTVLTNAAAGRLVADEVERWALVQGIGAVEPAPVFAEASRNMLAGYAGAYHSKLSTLQVTARGGRLRLSSQLALDVEQMAEGERPMFRQMLAARPRPLELGVVAADRVAVRQGPLTGTRGEFVRDGRGAVAWLRWGGRMHRRAAAG